ncbi:MAG: hypothetical protein IPM94_10915 [bacterium]|nr:hypothetical protein [bacterium]
MAKPRPLDLLPALVLLAGAAWLLGGGPHARTGFPLDDAWIHRVYARSFAHLQGFAYNPGQQETGATSPLWAIVSAPAHALQFAGDDAVVLAVKAIGLLAALAALLALASLTRALTGSRAAGIVAACVLAADPRLAYAALSGMEAPLTLALWLGGTAALVAGRRAAGLLLLGLGVTARPEMAVVAPLIAFPTLVLGWVERGGRRRLARDFGLALLPSALWALFCLAVTGRPLPATFYVKSAGFGLGPDQLRLAWQLLAQNGPLTASALLLGAAALAVLLVRRRSPAGDAAALSLLLAPVVYLLAVVAGRQIGLSGYYWTRWADPPALALTAAAGAGFGAAIARTGGLLPDRRRTMGRVLGGVLLFASLAGCLGAWSERRSRLESDGAAIARMNIQPALWLRSATPIGAVVGVNDAGALRYFSDRRVLDLIGLNLHGRAFGRTTLNELYQRMDWIAVFPATWSETNLMDGFAQRRVYTIPPAEYTVCDCPNQTTLVIGEKIGAR